jgi:hypothetical protein
VQVSNRTHIHYILFRCAFCHSYTTQNTHILSHQWLLEHGGANIEDRDAVGQSVYDLLRRHLVDSGARTYDPAAVTALLRVMVPTSYPPLALFFVLIAAFRSSGAKGRPASRPSRRALACTRADCRGGGAASGEAACVRHAAATRRAQRPLRAAAAIRSSSYVL